MSIKTATAIIDKVALINNFNVIKAISPNSQVLAVLKANAYGHGLERIAQALPNADAFGVARINEALALRAAGVVKPIVLLEGFFSKTDIPILAVNNFQTIVHNHEQLLALTNPDLILDKPLKVWLKIDTGMHRLGINPEKFNSYYQQLSDSDNVQDEMVLMSHLACADDEENDATNQQIHLFEKITKGCSEQRSLANSAGTFAWPTARYDWIRPGLLLYGVSPMAKPVDNLKIAPVMTLQSSLISVRKIPAGEAVGYGGSWQSAKPTTIGIVAIGYGDGYPRHANNGTPVLINGRKVPLVGHVSMDMITVDLGDNASDKIGDLAILWGKGLPIEDVAKHATTIPYELLCNITRRVNITEV